MTIWKQYKLWRKALVLIAVYVSQGDYDPLKTQVIHLKMNPTSAAKQQRQQEVETLQEEVTRLRELVRSLQEGGIEGLSRDDSCLKNPSLGLILPPSKEVLGKIHYTGTHNRFL